MLRLKKKLLFIIIFLISWLNGSQSQFSCYRDVPSMPLHRDEVSRENWIGLYLHKNKFKFILYNFYFILDRGFMVRGCSNSQNRFFAMFKHNCSQQGKRTFRCGSKIHNRIRKRAKSTRRAHNISLG